MPARPSSAVAAKVQVPLDLCAALMEHPKAALIFDKLPPSHKREYIKWITEAKRPETRQRRVASALDRLIAKSSAA
jgi:uncharacterized protein YdeI (YjbR/CyaY-like superfamily)